MSISTGWKPPLIKEYPGVRQAAEAELSCVLDGWTQTNIVGGGEWEYFFVQDGRLVNAAALLAGGNANIIGEIFASAGESATDPDVFAAGFYEQQLRKLLHISRSVRMSAKRHGYGVLSATAGMPLGVPDDWHPDKPGHLAMIANSERYQRMATNAFRWHGSCLPQIDTMAGSPMTVLPVFGGSAASFQANFSWPVQDFAIWRRTILAIAAVSHALAVGSPLLNGIATKMDSARVVTFPGSYYNILKEWPKYFSLAPGGYLYHGCKPLEGKDAVRMAYLAQLHEKRPFLAAPPRDWPPEKLAAWAQKSCYAGSRVRLGEASEGCPAHVRFEMRWPCSLPTPIDNVATSYCIMAMAGAFRTLYGDGANLRYGYAEKNFQRVVKRGLRADVEFLNPREGNRITLRAVADVATELLAEGRRWHLEHGFDAGEIDPLHHILVRRIEQQRTFAKLVRDWHDDPIGGNHAPDAFRLYDTIERMGATEVSFDNWPRSWVEAEASLAN